MEPGTETVVRSWTTPECPFQIDYSARVLDDVRLAVVDAFFSLPRGGAEIGGLLLGKFEDGRVTILDYEALDCEHAMGPSFTLSPRDQTLLAEMTAKARRNSADRQPLGWYHSHTRSEIFLSDADQGIHNRYFPEPWQIALVLKPHTFHPTRGGFFFREEDGSIHGKATYQEFVLEPSPLKPAAPISTNHRPLHEDSGSRIDRPTKELHPPPEAKDKGRVPITREIAVDPALSDPDRDRPDDGDGSDVPGFTQMREERSWFAVKAAVLMALLIVVLPVGYLSRQYWLPQVMTKVRPLLPKEPDAYLSLSVTDEKGQLIIQWDKTAPAIRNALDAALEITDGNTAPRSIRLDSAHLTMGSFRYGRESERVDISLTTIASNGQQVREQTSYLGKLPNAQNGPEDPQVRKERDALAEKADKLQKDLNFQASKTRKLEKDLKDMQDQMQGDKKGNQPPDGTKKN